MNLAITFRSELLKTKRTSAFYLTFFGALLITSLELLEMLTTNDSVQRLAGDPWQLYFRITLQMIGMITALYIILISTLLTQIEYRNNTWKQVFSSPQSELAVFISKFLNLQLLIITFLILNVVFLILGALLLNIIYPHLDLLHKDLDWQSLAATLSKAFICSLAMSTIQFWASLRFRNFIIPIAAGFVLWIMALTLIAEYESIPKEWYPYSYMMLLVIPNYEHLVPSIQWYSFAYTFVFLVIGFLEFRHRKGRG